MTAVNIWDIFSQVTLLPRLKILEVRCHWRNFTWSFMESSGARKHIWNLMDFCRNVQIGQSTRFLLGDCQLHSTIHNLLQNPMYSNKNPARVLWQPQCPTPLAKLLYFTDKMWSQLPWLKFKLRNVQHVVLFDRFRRYASKQRTTNVPQSVRSAICQPTTDDRKLRV